MQLTLSEKKKIVRQAIARWKQIMPDPRCELYYESEFQLLVSVVLSAKTTDKIVNRCMREIYKQGFTPQTVLEWGQDELLKRIRSIGLAPTKARNIFRLSEIIIQKYAGKIPRTRQELEELPGVGRKTANVILGELFGEPTLAVDTHVFRVGQRLGLHSEKNVQKAEQAMLAVFPKTYLPKGHHWLILHGRYTCKAQKPNCLECALSNLCLYFKNQELNKNAR